jgi:hypothetical protein
MLEWLLQNVVPDGQKIVGHLNEAHLDFQWWLALYLGLPLVAAAAVFIFWWQRRNLGTVPFPVLLALTTCRTLVLLLLVLVLAGPYLKVDHQSELKPIVALVFDHSQSMLLPAGPFEGETETLRTAGAAGYRLQDGKLDPDARKALGRMTRARLANAAVQTAAKSFLAPLNEKYEVQFYTFAKDVTPLGVTPAQPELPDPASPGGPATHIGDAIDHVLDEAAGRPVAGIVIFSDGQNTGGRSPTEAARTAQASSTPLFTVPTGAMNRLQDVAIVDVFTSGLVSVGDTARVAVTLESQGFDKRPVKIELRDGNKLLDTKEILLRGSEQQQVELSFEAKEAGPRYLTVHVPPLPEEPEYLRANNTDTAFVRVSDEKLRVLYIEGLPRWDFRFLKNAMRRDHGLAGRTAKEPDIVLEAEWRRRPADQQLAALPRKLDQLAEYHTIILGDVSPKLLTPELVELLGQAVREKGVGLVVEAGPLSMPHLYDKRLQDLLPVRLRGQAAGVEAPVYKPFRVELTPEGSLQEALRFYDENGRNLNAWSHLPPYYWCAAAERPAPAASVLVANPNLQGSRGKMPLIAHHYAGQGKVLFVGTDSTFLWRQNVGDRFFYKFWGQSIRFVARRDLSASKKSWMEVRPVRAQPGEQATVELMAVTPDGTPRTDPKLAVQVLSGGGVNALELTADATVKGRYTGTFPLREVGEYRVTYAPGGEAPPVEAKVRVTSASEELRHPNVNRPALELLAGTSGGQMVELPDLATIPPRLKGEPRPTEFHREATLWDNWLVLAVLVTLYSLDVGLRRLRGLS